MQRGSTRASFDAATRSVASARAEIASTHATAARARSRPGSGTGDSAQPAAIQIALAKRENAALDLARTTVRAPHDGIVSQTGRLQVGTIAPSGVPALSLVSSAGARVEANFEESELNSMRVGQPAEMTFDACPGVAVNGHVQSIGAGTGSRFSMLPAQNANGNWMKVTQREPVRVAIEGTPPCAMIAGLSAHVTIDTTPR